MSLWFFNIIHILFPRNGTWVETQATWPKRTTTGQRVSILSANSYMSLVPVPPFCPRFTGMASAAIPAAAAGPGHPPDICAGRVVAPLGGFDLAGLLGPGGARPARMSGVAAAMRHLQQAARSSE
jgi:hypothetical protein